MPDPAVDASALKSAAGDPWKRYVADHDAALDTVDAAITKLNAQIAAEQNPTKQASLEIKRDKLVRKRELIELKFTAGNAGQGQIKPPTAAEVAAHVLRAQVVANATAANMTASAIIQTATAAAEQFAALHV